jgi:hypothetical protein
MCGWPENGKTPGAPSMSVQHIQYAVNERIRVLMLAYFYLLYHFYSAFQKGAT